MNQLAKLISAIKQQADPRKAKILQWFFKTGKGEYGEGDIFLGLTVPKQRVIARQYKDAELKDLKILLKSKIHEYRLIALLVLVQKYQESQSKNVRFSIFKFYLANTRYINNWDLVDLSAEKIVGRYLYEYRESRKILYKLASSRNLWERRIAMLSTYFFIKQGQFKDTLKLGEILLKDTHDLIHKAVGWMLREVGKREVRVLEKFLKIHYKKMPRTALRYAIEKFPKKQRFLYLKGKI